MHIVFGIILIAVLFVRGDIKKWRHFHSTMLYVSLLVLLYNLLCQDKLLWVHKGDIVKSREFVELIHSIVLLPSISLLFLSNFPSRAKKRIKYIIIWVVCSLVIEWIFVKMDKIYFLNGYKFWMEAPFYIVMYCLIFLHHVRPLLTYGISIIIIILLMNVFHIPLK